MPSIDMGVIWLARFRVGVVGLVHDHIWDVLPHFARHPEVSLVGAADVNPPLLDKAKEEVGIDAHFSSAEELFDKAKPDIVLIYTDSATSADVVCEAAARGIHSVVEKPMTSTLERAERALVAAEQAGTYLMVNWPYAWNASYQHALALARAGDIGDLWHVRHHSSHAGPRELGVSPYFAEWLYEKDLGGGALMDYCCYGANFASYLLGRPGSVTGVAGRFVKRDIWVDDNAILILKYERALCMAEASWTQVDRIPYGLIINGTEGSLSVSPAHGFLRADAKNRDGVPVEAPPLPEGSRNPAEFLISRIKAEKPIDGLCDPYVNRDTQEILEAGMISAQSGTAVTLPVFSRG